jgi:hypothetical protein
MRVGRRPAIYCKATGLTTTPMATGALKPKRPFLLERGVDPDHIFRQTQRGEKRRSEAEE